MEHKEEERKGHSGAYRCDAVQAPTVATIKSISHDLGFQIAPDDLPHYQKLMSEWARGFMVLDELPEPTLPVLYPRTPGYRPTPHENTHNAWYYKADIKGASAGILKDKRVAIKDCVPVAGVPMMAGSRLLEGYVPEFDATVVTRILRAGGQIAGKAVCEDMCGSARSFLTAKGPVTNPYDMERDAGGSSSGCAVLVSVGEVDMAVGGDQGGSIRIPASWCGIVGLKPTYGLVPYTGVLCVEPSVDHVGPMARTVSDCALLLQAMAGSDNGLDSRQDSDISVPPYLELLSGEVAGLRIGLVSEGFEVCDAGVQSVVRAAVTQGLAARGAKVEDVSIPLHSQAAVLTGPLFALGEMVLSDSFGAPVGQGGFYPTSMVDYLYRSLKSRPNDASGVLKASAIYGEYHKRSYGPKYYCKSVNACRSLREAYDRALQTYDVLIMPTTPTTAAKLPSEQPTTDNLFNECFGSNMNTKPFNVSGHPALSVPAGMLDGLPVGLMIVGRHHQDGLVLNVGLAIEKQCAETPIRTTSKHTEVEKTSMLRPPGSYRYEAVQPPTAATIEKIAQDLGFQIAPDDLPRLQKLMSEWAIGFTVLDELPEPTLPVLYPRTPGYRPAPQENTHNAWYYKTDIKGASAGILKDKRVAIKDCVPVAGVPLMAGSRLLEGFVPEFDATVVTRILNAGGVICGKAVCDEMCCAAGRNLTAKAPVVNPYDSQRFAGGSSSGPAVLVSVGEVDMAVGGDQSGSIRIPASWCGIVGLKPTYGLVPYTGVLCVEPSIDFLGPMARTVSDCALLLQAMAGWDNGLDPRQESGVQVPQYSEFLSGEVAGLRICLVSEGFEVCDAGVQSVVRAAVTQGLAARGAKVEDVSIPLHSQANAITGPVLSLGTMKTLYEYCGAPFGLRGFHPTSMVEYISRAFKSRPNDVGHMLKAFAIHGEYHKRFYGPKYYCKSVNACRSLREAYDRALQTYDVLIMPTTPTTAAKLPSEQPTIESLFDVHRFFNHNTNSRPFNVSGHPALSVPAGMLDGLPVGLMIVGKHHQDGLVLNVGLAIEKQTHR